MLRILLLLALLCGVGLAEQSLGRLSQEYRQLRQVRGHFQGGEWVDAVDHWKGRKHEVMAQLGQRLAKGTRQQLEQWMGPPDDVVVAGEALWAYVRPPEAGATMLVFEWRGHHDFLYFVCSRGQISRSGWWMAGE